jgi:hypothetical protein
MLKKNLIASIARVFPNKNWDSFDLVFELRHDVEYCNIRLYARRDSFWAYTRMLLSDPEWDHERINFTGFYDKVIRFDNVDDPETRIFCVTCDNLEEFHSFLFWLTRVHRTYTFWLGNEVLI